MDRVPIAVPERLPRTYAHQVPLVEDPRKHGAAVDSLELAPLDREILWDYLERAAHAMVNTFEA